MDADETAGFGVPGASALGVNSMPPTVIVTAPRQATSQGHQLALNVVASVHG